jgi:hypothetical protein
MGAVAHGRGTPNRQGRCPEIAGSNAHGGRPRSPARRHVRAGGGSPNACWREHFRAPVLGVLCPTASGPLAAASGAGATQNWTSASLCPSSQRRRVYVDDLSPYLRWAACFETPSMAPISDHDRWAARAEWTALVSSLSTRSRCSASSAMASRDSVSATRRFSGSTRSTHRPRAAARSTRDLFMASTISSRTSAGRASRGSRRCLRRRCRRQLRVAGRW